MGLLDFIATALSRLRQPTEPKSRFRSTQSRASPFRVEQLEPRILLSADLVPQPDLTSSSQDSNDSAIVLFQDSTSGEGRVSSDEWNQPETRNSQLETLSCESVTPLLNEAVE